MKKTDNDKTQSFNLHYHIARGGHKTYEGTVKQLSDCFGHNSFLVSEDVNGKVLPNNKWKLVDGARKKLRQYIVEDNLIEDDNGTIVHLLEAETAIEQVKKTHLETILSLIDFCEECNGTSSTVSLETPLRHGWIIETTVKKKE